jgi:CheY-like chemotaxis protein
VNGLDALLKIEERCPDLVILDMNMPLMDGFEFLDKCTKKFHTIIVTNNHKINDEEIKKLGVDAYLIKNYVSLKQVTDLVQKILLPK